MQVRVRLFALQRQQLGRRDVSLELPSGATIEAAWAALVEAHAILAPARPSMRFARNGEYTDPSTILADGDELALIPPVAGGAADARARRLALGPAPIGDAEVNELRAAVADPADGAVVVFLGHTRTSPGTPAPGHEAAAARFAGQEVVGLDYEAYEAMALAVLEAIADEIERRFGVRRLAILHRTGDVAVGEVSVAIVAAAGHRAEAFDACRYAIEELKARAPIWKAERFADGSVWLGAPPRDGPPRDGRPAA
ncbi:MAG TPA: molybdenum cofactor biosynthesis protein MoaE [Candidatus Sulfotelmatobacter sp.]|nr:molybdenum cofactor biosynthesis protein MoaE [Candidatus Sulfotelmatobacter sp.]